MAMAVLALERGGNVDNITTNDYPSGQASQEVGPPQVTAQASSGSLAASLAQRYEGKVFETAPLRHDEVLPTRAAVDSGQSRATAPAETPTPEPTPEPEVTSAPNIEVTLVPDTPIAGPPASDDERIAYARAHLATIARCESGPDEYAYQPGFGYDAYNPAGPFYGRYQFVQTTWDWSVEMAGLPEYVGVDPRQAPPSIQDAAALTLYLLQGSGHWPVCQYSP